VGARSETQRMRRAERVYRRLLWLYPARFRREYEEAMVQLFRDQWRDPQRSASWHRRLGFWLFICADTGKAAGCETVKALRIAATSAMKMPKLQATCLRETGQRRDLGALIVGGALLVGAAGIFLLWWRDAYRRDADGPPPVTFCFTRVDGVPLSASEQAVIRRRFPYSAAQQKPVAFNSDGSFLWDTNLYRVSVVFDDWMIRSDPAQARTQEPAHSPTSP
jgi:hypothetical protein